MLNWGRGREGVLNKVDLVLRECVEEETCKFKLLIYASKGIVEEVVLFLNCIFVVSFRFHYF